MRPWSIIIRPLSSAAFLPAYYCSRFRTIRSRSCLYHPRVNRYRPTVKVSTLILSLRQTEPVALFQKWNDNSSSLFLYFFLFSLFFFFFWNTHRVEGEKGLEKEKGGLSEWKVAETRASSFDFSTLSFSRVISLANRWSNPSLDSI